MVKPIIHVCRECGFVFPEELSELIESRVQVYCEMCGTPFSLTGVEFKETDKYPKKPKSPYYRHGMAQAHKSNLSKAIKTLDKISSIPLIIFSGIVLGLIIMFLFIPIDGLNDIFSRLFISFSGILIIIYDFNYISPKIKQEKYDEIALDAFCYGILGCIIFGTGVILLIKGILVLIYVASNPERKEHKLYNFGLKLKNSLNNFSAKAGFVIITLTLFGIFSGNIDLYYITQGIAFIQNFIWSLEEWLKISIVSGIIVIFCLFPIILLLVDLKKRAKLQEKQVFTFGDSLWVFILGAVCTAFFSIGIFILLKGILIFFLFAGKPIDIIKAPVVNIEQEDTSLQPIPPKKPEYLQKEEISLEIKQKEPIIPPSEELIIREEKEIIVKEKEESKPEEKTPLVAHSIQKPEIERGGGDEKLKLHESLLPVKNEKDKKLVREYFTKIFNVLSKDLRNKILKLKLPKKEKETLLKELAFLTEQEQVKYINAISEMYKEIPRKLIERIKKLPNVKPQHYDKIVEQLKYMDVQERLAFIQFLEKNA